MLVEILAAIILISLALGFIGYLGRGGNKLLDRLKVWVADRQLAPQGKDPTYRERQQAAIHDRVMREHGRLVRMFNLPVPKPENRSD